MPHVLCNNCGHKFDDEVSFRVRPLHLPAYLAKSNRDEDVTYHFPYCPHCGSERGFRNIGVASLVRQPGGEVCGSPLH